jgi:hypothetical protein
MRKPKKNKNKVLNFLKAKARKEQGPVPPQRVERSKRTYQRKHKHKGKEID